MNLTSYENETNSENEDKKEIKKDFIFIHNLKVADFKKLYFKNRVDELDPLLRNLSPAKENSDITDVDLSNEEELHAAHQLLVQGLYYISRNDFRKAIPSFLLLKEYNKNDINAQFYSAYCYFHLDNNYKAIQQFKEILTAKNVAFYEEAQWHLALSYLKVNNTKGAHNVLQEIVSKDRFYAKKAKSELKQLLSRQ